MSLKEEVVEELVGYFSAILKDYKRRPEKDILTRMLNDQFTTSTGGPSLSKSGSTLTLSFSIDMDKFGEEL